MTIIIIIIMAIKLDVCVPSRVQSLPVLCARCVGATSARSLTHETSLLSRSSRLKARLIRSWRSKPSNSQALLIEQLEAFLRPSFPRRLKQLSLLCYKYSSLEPLITLFGSRKFFSVTMYKRIFPETPPDINFNVGKILQKD